MRKSKYSTNLLVMIALLSSLAYTLMFVGRVPMVSFLKYDPKDVIIMIGGIAYGPGVTVIISLIVSFIEFLTVSGDGIIGLFMNVLSTVSYVTLATIIYRRNYSMKNLVIGLVVGSLMTTIVMVAWNYIVTPWFLQIPRESVVLMLVPIIVPFNIIKSAINSVIIVLLYNPVVKALKLDKSKHRAKANPTFIIIISVIVLSSSFILLHLVNSL